MQNSREHRAGPKVCAEADPSSLSSDGLNVLLSPATSADALGFLGPGPHFTFSKTEHILQHNVFGGGKRKYLSVLPF